MSIGKREWYSEHLTVSTNIFFPILPAILQYCVKIWRLPRTIDNHARFSGRPNISLRFYSTRRRCSRCCRDRLSIAALRAITKQLRKVNVWQWVQPGGRLIVPLLERGKGVFFPRPICCNENSSDRCRFHADSFKKKNRCANMSYLQG